MEKLSHHGLEIEEANTARGRLGLVTLLRLITKLDDLELHQYRREGGWQEQDPERLFQSIAKVDNAPRLKRLVLRGVYVREQDLLTFLQRTCVPKLFLYHVKMVQGSFRSIFDHCTSNASGVDELYFDGLSET